MFWRTGCIGCGRICGGRRRRSKRERAGGEQAVRSDCAASAAELAGATVSQGNEQDSQDRSCPGWRRTKTPAVENEVSVTTTDRKSTRLNSSHLGISYAVFCLKKK